jgi:hypothetical protein
MQQITFHLNKKEDSLLKSKLEKYNQNDVYQKLISLSKIKDPEVSIKQTLRIFNAISNKFLALEFLLGG